MNENNMTMNCVKLNDPYFLLKGLWILDYKVLLLLILTLVIIYSIFTEFYVFYNQPDFASNNVVETQPEIKTPAAKPENDVEIKTPAAKPENDAGGLRGLLEGWIEGIRNFIRGIRGAVKNIVKKANLLPSKKILVFCSVLAAALFGSFCVYLLAGHIILYYIIGFILLFVPKRNPLYLKPLAAMVISLGLIGFILGLAIGLIPFTICLFRLELFLAMQYLGGSAFSGFLGGILGCLWDCYSLMSNGKFLALLDYVLRIPPSVASHSYMVGSFPWALSWAGYFVGAFLVYQVYREIKTWYSHKE